LNLYYNAFTSGTPNLQSALNVNYVNLSYNKLSGQIPAYRNLSNLRELYLHNNKYTGLSEFSNLPNLRYFYCHNQFTDGAPGISGQIPDFSSCPRMYYLIMYNNSFTSYDTGAFASLYQLKYLDISNNNLSAQALEQIVEDLYSNYTTTPRGGVTVNLKNAMQTGASLPETALETIVILRAKGWTVILQ
jgi:Leucine-rich repeat (LRR) protein